MHKLWVEQAFNKDTHAEPNYYLYEAYLTVHNGKQTQLCQQKQLHRLFKSVIVFINSGAGY